MSLVNSRGRTTQNMACVFMRELIRIGALAIAANNAPCRQTVCQAQCPPQGILQLDSVAYHEPSIIMQIYINITVAPVSSHHKYTSFILPTQHTTQHTTQQIPPSPPPSPPLLPQIAAYTSRPTNKPAGAYTQARSHLAPILRTSTFLPSTLYPSKKYHSR